MVLRLSYMIQLCDYISTLRCDESRRTRDDDWISDRRHRTCHARSRARRCGCPSSHWSIPSRCRGLSLRAQPCPSPISAGCNHHHATCRTRSRAPASMRYRECPARPAASRGSGRLYKGYVVSDGGRRGDARPSRTLHDVNQGDRVVALLPLRVLQASSDRTRLTRNGM